jgi:hypothetical protein
MRIIKKWRAECEIVGRYWKLSESDWQRINELLNNPWKLAFVRMHLTRWDRNDLSQVELRDGNAYTQWNWYKSKRFFLYLLMLTVAIYSNSLIVIGGVLLTITTIYLYNLYQAREIISSVVAYEKQTDIRLKQEKAKKEKRRQESEERRTRLYNDYGKDIGNRLYRGNIWIGMTGTMLREAKGQPENKKRTVFKTKTKERWYYRAGTAPLTVVLENGSVVSWSE